MSKELKLGLSIGGFVIAVIILISLLPFGVIGAGERGVVFNNLKGVENRVLPEGTYFRIPLVESVISMPIRVQKKDDHIGGASKDLQTVAMDLTVNWQLNPSRVNVIYQKIGDIDTVSSTILENNIQQSAKAEISQYNVESIQTQRDRIASNIFTELQKKVTKYNIVILGVSVNNLEFSDQFNQAIEAKQVAQQQAEQAAYLKEQRQNEADALRIQAQGQADANAKLQQSLTSELIEKMAIDKWDGKLPTYTGNNPVPFLTLPSLPSQ